MDLARILETPVTTAIQERPEYFEQFLPVRWGQWLR